MEFEFKKTNPSTDKRKQESQKIREKYPDRVPVICEKDPKSKMKSIDKTKYLVPNDLTVSQFSYIIRKRLELDKSSALFLLVSGKHSITGGKKLIFKINLDSALSEIYEKYADKDDGFLYISYTSEITWGN